MGRLDGRVVIVTGAGRGLGRAHALLMAGEGARVVVNDLGVSGAGGGSDGGPAQSVVDEIRAAGGEAVANTDSVADWDGARRLVNQAVDTFGELHVVVNNAGFLRDRMLVNMSEPDLDSIVAVHLKGTFAVSRWAATYWREQAKAGTPRRAAIINTSSASGLHGIRGQTNYGAAKAGILNFTLVAAGELARYGIRVNAIAPQARTRLTLESPGTAAVFEREADVWDRWDPANVSPLVAHLATAACALTGQIYSVGGSRITAYQGWTKAAHIDTDGRWDLDDLAVAIQKLPTNLNPLFGE